MELRNLAHFVSIAESGSFTKAARQLRLAQPGLSREINKLEDELHAKLFVRYRYGVKLTDTGKLLLKHANKILAQVNEALLEIQADGTDPVGTMHIGLTPSAGHLLVPALLASSRADYPGITVKVFEGFSGDIHRALNEGRINLGLISDPLREKHLLYVPLVTEPLYVISHPGDEAHCARRAYKLCELDGLPLAMPSSAHSLRNLIQSVAKEHDIALNVQVEANGLEIIKAVVRSGQAYALMEARCARSEVEQGQLVMKPVSRPGIFRTLHLVYPRTWADVPMHKTFAMMTADLIVGLAGTPSWPEARPLTPIAGVRRRAVAKA